MSITPCASAWHVGTPAPPVHLSTFINPPPLSVPPPFPRSGSLVLEEGELRWPPPANVIPQANTKVVETKEKKPEGPIDLYEPTKQNALVTSTAIAATLAIGATSPNAAFSSMLAKFGLASICGYQTVWGVTPALHSPLMSVTNAVSGLTAVGGMLLAGGGLLPTNAGQALAATAVAASAVNIGGGFTITQRMLDMFKRPTDPIEHNKLYGIPGGCCSTAAVANYLPARVLGSAACRRGWQVPARTHAEQVSGCWYPHGTVCCTPVSIHTRSSLHPPPYPPAATLVGGYVVGSLLAGGEAPGLTSASYLVSSALCIAAIGCLANQSSARAGGPGNAEGCVPYGVVPSPFGW